MIPVRYKNRISLVIWYLDWMSLPFLIGYLHSATELGPLRWGLLLPSLAGLVLPAFWPYCPHCRQGILWPRRSLLVLRWPTTQHSYTMARWIWPSPNCPNCDQALEGPPE